MRAALIALLVAAPTAIATGCGPGPEHIEVSIGGERWTAERAGPDGMRGRSGFDGADAMLFDQGAEVDPGSIVFVMDGVTIPLEIAWFDAAGDLVGTASMAPCPAEPCPRYAAPAPFRWALEAPPGAFDGLSEGARLDVGD